jgi:hypothetical protein
MILPSLQPGTHIHERDYEVGFATKAQGSAKTYVFQVRIPRRLLGEIGDPKRIVVEGKPHEGYTIRPTVDRNEGSAVNYKLPGHLFFFAVAFKPTKLTKVERRLTVARARVVDGVIRTGGMPEGWIRGDSLYAGKKATLAVVAAEGGATVRLPANPKSGQMPERPRQSATAEAAAITERLNAALATARVLRTALEQQTGLQFRITQGLRLVLAEKPQK